MVAVQGSHLQSNPDICHVLLIHDDLSLLDSLSTQLRDGGFRVHATDSRADALGLTVARPPHLVLIGLTHAADAAELCRRLRSLTDAPLYILAERLQSSGMMMQRAGVGGVHIIPPCDDAGLLALLDAAFREMQTPRSVPDDDRLTIGDLEISPSARTVVKLGRTIDLSPIEFRLLAMLARAPGIPVSYRQLLTEVWGPDYAEDVQNLRIYIRYLRAKIEDEPNEPRYILTEWGTGYRLAMPSDPTK